MLLDKIPYHYEETNGTQSDHDLLATQTSTALYEYALTHRGVKILDDGRYHNEGGVFSIKIPDGWYLKQDGNGLMFRIFEVIAGVESSTDMREMFEGWERWAELEKVKTFLTDLYIEHGAQNPEPAFELHCILQSRNWKHTDAYKERRLLALAAEHCSEEMLNRIWSITNDALSVALDEKGDINVAGWHCGKDLIEICEELPQDDPQGRRFDAAIRDLPTYALFA